MQDREVAGADEFHCAILAGAADYQGGELSGESAFAEDAVGVFDHAIEREAGFGEAAEGGAEMAHEHGRSYAVAGNVAQHKEQTGLRFEKVAIIAADHAGGLVVIADVPA